MGDARPAEKTTSAGKRPRGVGEPLVQRSDQSGGGRVKTVEERRDGDSDEERVIRIRR